MRANKLTIIPTILAAIALCMTWYVTGDWGFLIISVFACDVLYAAYSVNQRDISWRRYFAGMTGASVFKLFLYYVACAIYVAQYIPWPDGLLTILGVVLALFGLGTICALVDIQSSAPEPFKSIIPINGPYKALKELIGGNFNVIVTRSASISVPAYRSYNVHVLEFPQGNAHHMFPCYAIFVNRENWMTTEPGYIPAMRMVEILVGTAAFVDARSYEMPMGLIYYISPDKYNPHATSTLVIDIDNAWKKALTESAPMLESVKADLDSKWPKETKENQMMHAALLLYLQRKGQLHTRVLYDLAKELNI